MGAYRGLWGLIGVYGAYRVYVVIGFGEGRV